ncbi:MAG: alpha/beta fold hydrolase [Propionibacteriaceae bacterium]|nr:alpha/beta fold hydrolase [Propionibacteriaceae bacterium]
MATDYPVRPEARPIRAGDGEIGVVMSHGFTGTVASIRTWAKGLAQPDGDWSGVRVVAPRLPGHGTHWKDLERTRWWDWYNAFEDAYLEVAETCRHVFVAGLSMGGALSLRLAGLHQVRGVLLVNPAIASRDLRIRVGAKIHRLIPPQKGIASDIALPGVEEPGYSQFSATSVATMRDLWIDTQAKLPRISSRVLLMTSTVDHVVDGLSRELIRQKVLHVEDVELTRSYHVATMDHDAGKIIAESRRFITERVAGS